MAGCGGTRFVYDQLDVLIPWYFRDYVDLDTGQRKQFQRSVDALLIWHRESQVGRYAAFLRDLGQAAGEPFGRERLEAARRDLDRFWDDVARQLAPEAAELLRTLDDGQIDEMFRRIADKDREIAERAAERGPAERHQRREKGLRRAVERWVGRLDDAQRAMIADCAGDLRGDTEGWLASRRQWQQALRDALELRGDPGRFVPELERLLADGDAYWTADYRRAFEADRQRVIGLIVDIDSSLSPEQRDRLVRRLDRWARDFESIAGGA